MKSDPAGDCLRVRGACPEAVFCANAALLVPLSSLLRRQLVLAASNASVQWFLLESLSKMFEKLGLCLVKFSNLLNLFPSEGDFFSTSAKICDLSWGVHRSST